MQKIKNALESNDSSKFQALYQARNNWPPIVGSIRLHELSECHKMPEQSLLEQWADEMETPPFLLSQFEADWSVVTKDNIDIPYNIMDATEDWTLRPDCNGMTYLMRAAQLRDDELIRRLLRNCASQLIATPRSSSSSSSKSSSSRSSKSSSSSSSSKSDFSFILQKDKKGLHALDYAIIAGGTDVWPVIEFLQWVDIKEVTKSLKHAKRSYFSKINRVLVIIGLVYADDRKWYRKKHHILRENIIQLNDEYQECYDMKDLVAPDKHGYTGLMLAADTNLQEHDILVEVMLYNTPKDEINAVDDDGVSALDYAIARNNSSAIKKITDASSD